MTPHARVQAPGSLGFRVAPLRCVQVLNDLPMLSVYYHSEDSLSGSFRLFPCGWALAHAQRHSKLDATSGSPLPV